MRSGGPGSGAFRGRTPPVRVDVPVPASPLTGAALNAIRILGAAVLACTLTAFGGWAASRVVSPDDAGARVDRGREALRSALDAERALGASLASAAAPAASIEDRPSQFAALAVLERPGWGVAIVRDGGVEAWAGVLPSGLAGWALEGESGIWETAAWSWLWFRRPSGSAHAVSVRALRPGVPLRPELRRDAFPADEIARRTGVLLRWEGEGPRQDLGGGVGAILEAPPEARLLSDARRVPLAVARGVGGLALLLVMALGILLFLRTSGSPVTRHVALLVSLWGGRFAALHLGIPAALFDGPLFDPSQYGTLRFFELARSAGEVALTSLVGAVHLAAVTVRAGRSPAGAGWLAPLVFGGVVWVFSQHLASVVRDARAVDLLETSRVLPMGAAAALWVSLAAGALSCLLAGRLAVLEGGESLARVLPAGREVTARLIAAGLCGSVVLAVFRAPVALALAAWLPLIAPRRAVLPLVAVGGILAGATVTGFTLLGEADRSARASLADRVERATEWQDALYRGLAEELAKSLLRLPADRPPGERDLLEIWASSAAAREGLGVGVGWSDGTSWWTFAVGMPEWDPKALVGAPSASPEPVALRGGLLLDHTVIAERPGQSGKTIATVRARADETPLSILRAGAAAAGTEALWRGGRWLPPGLLADPPKLEPGAEEWRVLEIGGERHEVAFRRQEGADGRVWAFSRRVTGPGESAVRLLRVLVILVGCGVVFAAMLAFLAGLAGTIPVGWTGLLEVRLTIALVVVSAVPLIVLGLFARTLAVHPLDAARSRLDQETAGIALQGLYAARSGQFSAVDDRSVMNMESLVGRDLFFYRNGQLQALGQPALRTLDLVPGMVPGPAWRSVALGESVAFTESEGFRSLSGAAGWYPGNRTRKVTLAVPEPPGPPSHESGRAASLALGGCTLIALLLWPVSAVVARRISGPVAALTRAAERIEEGDLAARVEAPAEGEVADLVAAFNRMTEGLARGRDALARAERERAWREMARQVAHEIKNPLTPLKLALQNLRAAWREKDPAFGRLLEDSVDLTVNQIDILARIATDFSQFAGRPRRTVLPLDLNVILREVLDLFRPTAAGITIVEDCEQGLQPVPADRAEMIRVFTNLVKNAVQAMPAGGLLTVTTRNEVNEVEVRIRDTGAGIPEDVRQRIFEPYFSTKSEGTGLGLGIVRRVLDDMGGRIAFESEPGRGTVMILRMPAGGAPANQGADA